MKRLILLIPVVLLAACSAAPASPMAPTAVQPAASAGAPMNTTPSPTPTLAPTPSPAAPTTFEVGQEVATRAATFLISESKVIDPKDRNVQAFMLKSCLSASVEERATFSSARWTALGPDGERYQPSEWTDIQPGYLYEMEVDPGECVKGWLQFDTKDKLTELRYENAQGERFSYRLG